MRISFLAAVSTIAIALSACTTVGPSADAVTPASSAPLRADVNTDYKAGKINGAASKSDTLQEILDKTKRAPEKSKDEDQEDKLRLPAMKEAASSYGARAGLAFSTKEINRRLDDRSSDLTKIYNFQKVMIQGPNDVMVQPPVIVEAQDAWEATDAGKTLRVADKVYEIVDSAKFTPVAPLWQNYLIVNFDNAEEPPQQLLPRNEDEEKLWKNAVADGWKMGEAQAEETFQANLDRLNRDFIGMVRYRSMLEECKVNAPTIADGNLGTTGTGQNMRENDRLNRITQDALLNVSSKCWGASVTTTDKAGETVGIPANQTNVAAPAPTKPAPVARQPRPRSTVPTKAHSVKPETKNVYPATSSGTGRF
jgi:defect-in-organelle-trafficking protein DotC